VLQRFPLDCVDERLDQRALRVHDGGQCTSSAGSECSLHRNSPRRFATGKRYGEWRCHRAECTARLRCTFDAWLKSVWCDLDLCRAWLSHAFRRGIAPLAEHGPVRFAHDCGSWNPLPRTRLICERRNSKQAAG
jgi:hypothetical protein